MKTHLLAFGFCATLPFIAAAQTYAPTEDATEKPKPVEPVLKEQHSGPGRLGVRIAFDKATGLPVIVGMTRGGPAADAGFEIGDVIIKIDKNYTDSLTQDEVRLALHGEPSTGVELTVQRGDDPRLIVRAAERRILTMDAEDIPLPVVTETKP